MVTIIKIKKKILLTIQMWNAFIVDWTSNFDTSKKYQTQNNKKKKIVNKNFTQFHLITDNILLMPYGFCSFLFDIFLCWDECRYHHALKLEYIEQLALKLFKEKLRQSNWTLQCTKQYWNEIGCVCTI